MSFFKLRYTTKMPNFVNSVKNCTKIPNKHNKKNNKKDWNKGNKIINYYYF